MSAPDVLFRPDLLAAGWTDGELRRMRRSGRLATLRPGAYLPADAAALAEQAARHRLMVQAALRSLAVDAVVSHASAAVLLGLPVWGLSLAEVHVIRRRRTGGRRRPGLHVHALSLPPHEVTTAAGIAVTAPGRTLVDIGRSSSFDAAVAIADAALRDGLIDPDELLESAIRARGRPGAAQARRMAAFADGRSESVGESRSRIALHRAGLPTPALQVEVCSPAGRLIGRSDFGWPERRTLGEFDGRAKYGRLLRPGEGPGDVVFAEKIREDALRDAGFRVVRWTWDDLGDFTPVAARLRRAFDSVRR